MADISLNATGAATANPYTPTDYTIVTGTLQNTNGTGMRSNTNTVQAHAYYAPGTWGPVVTVDFTIPASANGFGDNVMAGVMVRSGANAGAALLGHWNGTELRVYRRAAAGTLTSISAQQAVAAANGDIAGVTITLATGDCQRRYNGANVGAVITDTTFISETDWGPCFGFNPTNSNARRISLFEATGISGGSPPSVTDVDSDEAFASNATGVTITGTDLGATTGDRTVELVQGATEVAQTQTAGNATSGAFTVVGWGAGGLLSYGVSTDLKVATSEGDDSLAVTVNPPSGFAYVDIVTPDTEADYRIEGDPVDIEAGDQIEYATTTSSGSTVEIDDAGVVTETGGDHTADPLSFTPATGAELGAVTASAAETISGVDATFTFRIQDGAGWGASGTVTIAYTPTIAIVGGEYRINAGSWTSAPGTVAEGDEVEVRGTASDFYDTETFVTVSIDSDEYQFSVTTRAADFDAGSGSVRGARSRGFIMPLYGRG